MPKAPPPFVPDATLGQVAPGWWLELRCGGCRRLTYWPRRMLVDAFGTGASVPALLVRLRCQDCRGGPVLAGWVDNPSGGAHGSGYAPERRVPLALPCPAVRPARAASSRPTPATRDARARQPL